MPRREDLHKILVLGSGPIIIGQACEFDYSGTQACKALREEGYEVILVNSNPATIMTDPEMSDRTYVEPLVPEVVARIIEKERPDALLPTIGGQTALNLAVALGKMGIYEQYGVELIGASLDAINRAEDRELFKETILQCGLRVPLSGLARNAEEARRVREEVGLPCVIRPAFTLGGEGGGIAYNVEEFDDICAGGLARSPITEVLIEQYLHGWKEFELEVMRDCADNVVIICSIENLDPMGVHTGDSITVAPAQTLTDKEYQLLRDASQKIIRAIGVDTGGSNIQFAVNPADGTLMVIEMNPRVSRSSALASKATGFPIAKIAAKLAVGYHLDEIPNDITRKTPACFEPTIDYVVTKIPRFTFEKFPGTSTLLTSKMKSVGEAMAIGRTFTESLQKAFRSLETGHAGLGLDRLDRWLAGDMPPLSELRENLRLPRPDRLLYVRYGLRHGLSAEEVADLTRIDPWFIDAIVRIIALEDELLEAGELGALDARLMRRLKENGFSDSQIATALRVPRRDVTAHRKELGVLVTFKMVDTCAAEFEAATPYYYSTYERTCEMRPSDRKRIMILGGGPNRIGQGIEFDYCCVHAAMALSEIGFETVMVNSNPETVSTDYDTSDLLFFEPLTVEDVLAICDVVEPHGVIVQLGGQTPLNLAAELEAEGVPIIGTGIDAIDLAENRERFKEVVERLELLQPRNDIAFDVETAVTRAAAVGFPVVVRPSYVLGGRAMEICYDTASLESYMKAAVDVSPQRPVLLDQFLEEAVEVDVDVVADGSVAIVAGVMEHIEEAGIHSGDSSCLLPPYSLGPDVVATIRAQACALALELGVRGLMNAQFAVKEDRVYLLEVNPRASRTVPFVSKAVGISFAKIAAKVMAGMTLEELHVPVREDLPYVAVKAPVFPFARFPGADIVLGPEMRSTGEVMGIDIDRGLAMAKAQAGVYQNLPTSGRVILSVKNADKRPVTFVARKLLDLGFSLAATGGTRRALIAAGLVCDEVYKIKEGRPNILDFIANEDVNLVINTPSGQGSHTDRSRIRTLATIHGIPCFTTLSGATAAVNGIAALKSRGLRVGALQDFYALREKVEAQAHAETRGS